MNEEQERRSGGLITVLLLDLKLRVLRARTGEERR